MRALCVDTSFLIDLWVEYYPPKEFSDLWTKVLPDLIERGLFFAPHEVFQELSGKAADLKRWAHSNRKMFRAPTVDSCKALLEILKSDPGCVDRHKRGPHADALVVAMALATGAIAVTRERRDGADPFLRKPRVHTLCRKNKVDCYVTVSEFRKHINWPDTNSKK